MRHSKHIVRLVSLLGLVVVLFLIVRSLVVPKDFGKLGHFRASAIDEAAARESRHIGNQACNDCHGEMYSAWSKGKHTRPQCENCHGPGLLHRKLMSGESIDAYPDVIKKNKNAIRVPTGIQECKWCHLKTFERPSSLKFITGVESHISGMGGQYGPGSKCTDCHNPHTTEIK